MFDVDQDLVSETEWFDDEIIGTKHGDFFVKRSINYSKKNTKYNKRRPILKYANRQLTTEKTLLGLTKIAESFLLPGT